MQSKIILVRHGDAVGADIAGQDWDRWLSERGRREVASVAQKLVAAGFREGPILTSPLVRALQTAEILDAGRSASEQGNLSVLRVLSTDDANVEDIQEVLGTLDREQCVTLVGHMPFLQELGAHLCNDRDFPVLSTAEVRVLERRAHGFSLCQTFRP